jgi:hypothetical protein
MAMPEEFVSTRITLQRVGAHVLARRRHQITGRFGLRAAPGGFATPAFGDGAEVLRVAGGILIHETAAGARCCNLQGSTLRALGVAVGTDMDAEFSVGRDTPEIGDLDEPLSIDEAAAHEIGAWYASAAVALDGVLGELPTGMTPAVPQLWPEHFDLATHVATRIGGGDDERVNLGASPGDGFCDEPYAYVGPWQADRPGDATFWNAPFGAVIRRSDFVLAAHGPVDGAIADFFRRGLAQFADPGQAQG